MLTPYHYHGCFDDIDYSNIRHNGASYNIRDLERALVIPERDRAIIQKWRELADEKPTIAFCCSRLHARRMMKSFREEGVLAEVYISDTSMKDRQAVQRRFRTGKLRVLCVVDVLNEGADFPFIECLLFLRPTESARIFYQQLGRGLRRCVGKSHCTVIDFIGNFKNAHKIIEYQALLTDPDEFNPLERHFNPKAVLNLPLGCRVEFDDRVVDLFASQTLDPRHANRHNIAPILVNEYRKLWRSLGRKPRARDVDRNSRLGSDLYRLVFGNWSKFDELMDNLG